MASRPALLSEIIRYVGVDGVDTIRVSNGDKTVVEAQHDKILFVRGEMERVPEFKGVFALRDLKMLSGILGIGALTNDSAKVVFSERTLPDGSLTVDEIVFRGNGARSTYKTMDVSHLRDFKDVPPTMPWSVSVSDIAGDRVKDFQKFANLYSSVEKDVFFSTDDDLNLILSVGKEHDATHSGSMVLATASAPLLKRCKYPIDKILMLLKLAISTDTSVLTFSEKGILGVNVTTENGVYQYYLRQMV